MKALLGGAADLCVRDVAVGPGSLPGRLCWLDGCAAALPLALTVILPLASLPGRTGPGCVRAALRGGIFAGTVRRSSDPRETAQALSEGFAALFLPGTDALLIEVKASPGRGVEAPTVERSVLGAKESFTEILRVNTALLRRRLPGGELLLKEIRVGTITRTSVAVICRRSAEPRAGELLSRLEALSVPGVCAAGDVERALTSPPRGVFPQVIHTERPDRFVQGLLRGQVGVLCDGLPVGFLTPASLPEMMDVAEDQARHALVARALLCLRWCALFLSLLLPAVYVAAATFHPEMVPFSLLQSLIRAKEAVPFSSLAEVLGMLLAFELLQEAGVRLPEPVGQTISVIGALIVGQSAVEAKVLSPVVIIAVALAGIGGYAQPSQEAGAAIRVWRTALVLCAGLLGLFGTMAGLMILLWRLCDMENLGQCLLWPLCDREGPLFSGRGKRSRS